MAVRLGGRLKELRIHLCQVGKQSEGVRNFVKDLYPQLKESNPKFPILIRECSGIKPKLWARYEKGQETCVKLDDCNAADVMKKIEQIAKN
ncbi:NADH dehydrogenase [ubiquinone] 1 alpha subcomplex subunit 2 [Chrysoperla carnea]|uniref:NADH dehydrogenase [ubiquinone] 1 alpha subcomplex subunit 2 n=1 Tax=Chrysoperla carnea TaxID=189513 RepID=UPI001D097B6C|nr:NADH dehydrogenase [ubiquinone] 1 alpha subcomplex subunit 2 [Chrysoperla carnea]